MTQMGNNREAALMIVEQLRAAGHTAYFAGGCVRDQLLGITPKDYDVATDALPRRVQELFPGSQLVGAKFGVVVVRKLGVMTEVATFRSDGVYSDGRRPDAVVFGDEVQDARRRDFTINGLFLDPLNQRVIDHVGGQEDLKQKLVRTIGDPNLRFAEDHLRMLRGVRLAARLGFSIEKKTADAIRAHAPKLVLISPERVWLELEMILRHPSRAAGWKLLTELGLPEHLVRGISWPESMEDIERRLKLLGGEEMEATIPLAAILVERGRYAVEDLCRSLRLSNQQIADVQYLIRGTELVLRDPPPELADIKELMVHPKWSGLLAVAKATERAKTGGTFRSDAVERRAKAIDPASVAPAPLLRGEEVMDLGVPKGPKLGKVLRALHRAQLNEEIRTREEAKALVRELERQALE